MDNSSSPINEIFKGNSNINNIFKEDSNNKSESPPPQPSNTNNDVTTSKTTTSAIPIVATYKEPKHFFFKTIRNTFLRALNVNTYFILLYTVAVIVDGVYDLHINTNDILIGYTVIVGKNLINHGINSVLNSKSGEMPTKQDSLQTTQPTAKPPTNVIVDKK